MAQRAFKTDESFLEKLAIGAVGTRRVIGDLRAKGHAPVELERGSSGYKIWKSIKIKRIRVPDILLVDSGIRVESRAKTKLVISMSHSSADETRGWDFGLEDDDYTAFVVCHKCGRAPVDWEADELVQYIQVRDLRSAFDGGNMVKERPKGAEEGFESRITWPTAVASSDGKVSRLSDDKLQFRRAADSRTSTLKLTKAGITLTPTVSQGDVFRRNAILASATQVQGDIHGRVIDPQTYYLDLLNSVSLSDRYTALKAFSHLAGDFYLAPVRGRLGDNAEHIYVRLEAAAVLARRRHEDGFAFIRSMLDSNYLDHRLEAVITLGEIASENSCMLLRSVLKDPDQHEEIRARAAWALGELNSETSIPDLVSTFAGMHEQIRIEAARALRRICDEHTAPVLDAFVAATGAERPGIAWALSRSGRWQLTDMMERMGARDLDMRQWIAYMIGRTEEQTMIESIEELKQQDPEVYFAATVLWKVLASWVHDLKEY